MTDDLFASAAGQALPRLIGARKSGRVEGIWSLCSANRWAIEAGMLQAAADDRPLLIESTSNQVNQFGGYTGITPAAFVAYVEEVARSLDFPFGQVILGGDHLGPGPWQDEPSAQAMDKSRAMMADYVAAGYGKIHLDPSMRCADDPPGPLAAETIADRAADLCDIAERAAARRPPGAPPLYYVIGTEVPVPGGAVEEEALHVTRAEDVARTIEITRRAFADRGLDAAWQRVIAVVVQPGVEFGHDSIVPYQREKARHLTRFIEGQSGLVYEVHSTDYQTPRALRELVEDQFAIQKVGPALTFALREALVALELIEQEWFSTADEAQLSRLRATIEQVMLDDPTHWQKYYGGEADERRRARRFSFSDRVRYYWPRPELQAAIGRLLRNLSSAPIPLTLLSQYLPVQYAAIREGSLVARPADMIRHKIMETTGHYAAACRL